MALTVVDCATVSEIVVLGEVTCPSSELVLMDGGYLGLWSGDRTPDDVRQPDVAPAVDFEVVGRDADAAARSFDRQSGCTLYYIPQLASQGSPRSSMSTAVSAVTRRRCAPFHDKSRTVTASGERSPETTRTF